MPFETTFSAEIWRWDARAEDSWYFVSLPQSDSELLSAMPRPPRGFGSIRVRARIGSARWETSVFPDSKTGRYVLPIKAAVRRAEDIAEGDHVEVDLAVRDDFG